MEIKVYEGEDLQNLIDRAKQELGEKVRILYYEEYFERVWWLPLKKKKRYKLFVEKQQEEEKKPEIDFDEIMEKMESLIEEKIKQTYPITEKTDIGIKSDIEDFKEFTGEALDLIKLLTEKGVQPEVAKKVIESACGLDIESGKMDLNTSTYGEALIKGIEENIKFSVDFNVENKDNNFRVISFVGPTGVGKTTNLFKIASNFILNKNLKVGVISTDTFKVGAIQQARFYANILNIPFYTTADSKNLRETLFKMSDMDFVFIDTVGRSHYDAWKLGEIKEILKGSIDWLDCVLTISCNFNYQEAINVINNYKRYFPIKYILFTKIDETSTPGILLNIPIKTGLPVSYISTGQKVPEDIKILTPKLIASYLLEDFNE